jgi:hypothetical protein
MQELDYQTAYNELYDALLDMKGYMEYLRDNNPDAYEKRAYWLTTAWTFLKASGAMQERMEQEINDSYSRGVEVGRRSIEKQNLADALRDWLRMPRRFERTGLYWNNPDLHEDIREYTKMQAQSDFPHLF